MNIQAGIILRSNAWEQMLLQEGLPFLTVDLEREESLAQCGLLIINRYLSGSDQRIVEQYLSGGGAILGYAGFLNGVAGTIGRRERLEYLVQDPADAVGGIALMDLGMTGEIPREANALRTQNNEFAMFAGELQGGFAVILPFDPEVAITDHHSATKSFYWSPERLPQEHVSLVSKGELGHILHGAFEYLHHKRGLPYVHLWYFPGGKKNVFAFRVDTDGASREEIDELYRIATEHNVGMTWYLDVKSHEQLLGHFGFMTDQEIGVHCYEHEVFPTYEANIKNIMKARRLLEAAGISPEGFAAPYGKWNHELARAVDDLGFLYSSEFSYIYDALPLYPESGGKNYRALQVPVHPVCPGSIRKIGYSGEQMQSYFKMVVDEKLARHEPLFFYHHPTHRSWDTVRYLLGYVHQLGIDSITLGEYAQWWKHRMHCRSLVTVNGQSLTVQTRMPSEHMPDLALRVTRSGDEEAIIPTSPQIDLNAVRWNKPAKYTPAADLRRIREFDPRGILGDLYSKFMRKFK